MSRGFRDSVAVRGEAVAVVGITITNRDEAVTVLPWPLP